MSGSLTLVTPLRLLSFCCFVFVQFLRDSSCLILSTFVLFYYLLEAYSILMRDKIGLDSDQQPGGEELGEEEEGRDGDQHIF